MVVDHPLSPSLLHMYFLHTCCRVQANATGRSAKSVREFLEKHYSPEAVQSRDDTVMLAIKALLEVVQSGSKSMELAVMEKGEQLKVIFLNLIPLG